MFHVLKLAKESKYKKYQNNSSHNNHCKLNKYSASATFQ